MRYAWFFRISCIDSTDFCWWWTVWMGSSRISKNHQFLGGWLLEFYRMHALDYFWPYNIIGYNLNNLLKRELA